MKNNNNYNKIALALVVVLVAAAAADAQGTMVCTANTRVLMGQVFCGGAGEVAVGCVALDAACAQTPAFYRLGDGTVALAMEACGAAVAGGAVQLAADAVPVRVQARPFEAWCAAAGGNAPYQVAGCVAPDACDAGRVPDRTFAAAEATGEVFVFDANACIPAGFDIFPFEMSCPDPLPPPPPPPPPSACPASQRAVYAAPGCDVEAGVNSGTQVFAGCVDADLMCTEMVVYARQDTDGAPILRFDNGCLPAGFTAIEGALIPITARPAVCGAGDGPSGALPPVVVGCMTADVACGDAIVYASRAGDATATVYEFPNTCIPESFAYVDFSCAPPPPPPPPPVACAASQRAIFATPECESEAAAQVFAGCVEADLMCAEMVVYARQAPGAPILRFDSGCLPAGFAAVEGVPVAITGRPVVCGAGDAAGGPTTALPPAVVGCMLAESLDIMCGDAITYASRRGEAGIAGTATPLVYEFSSTCIPEGFEVVADFACPPPAPPPVDGVVCTADETPLLAAPVDEHCWNTLFAGPTVTLGCLPPTAGMCPQVQTFARSHATGAVFVFASGCLPEGFTALPADAGCDAVLCAAEADCTGATPFCVVPAINCFAAGMCKPAPECAATPCASLPAGASFTAADGCNTCTCIGDGEGAACTEMGCPPPPPPPPAGDDNPCATRVAGETFTAADGCNTCTCGADPARPAMCTKLACPGPVPPPPPPPPPQACPVGRAVLGAAAGAYCAFGSSQLDTAEQIGCIDDAAIRCDMTTVRLVTQAALGDGPVFAIRDCVPAGFVEVEDFSCKDYLCASTRCAEGRVCDLRPTSEVGCTSTTACPSMPQCVDPLCVGHPDPTDGFKAPDGCNTCSCGFDGSAACTLMACSDTDAAGAGEGHHGASIATPLAAGAVAGLAAFGGFLYYRKRSGPAAVAPAHAQPEQRTNPYAEVGDDDVSRS